MLVQRVRHVDRAVLPAGTANGNDELVFPLLHIVWNEEIQHLVKHGEEFVCRAALAHIGLDLRLLSRVTAQGLHIVRIRQKTHVKHQICLQRQSVLDAIKMASQGLSAKEIKDALVENKMNSSIYITVETLKYLKKGGRITPVAAAIGTLLNIKPVLQIQGEKLDAYSKVRGKKAARGVMIKTMKKDLEKRFSEAVKNGKLKMGLAFSGNPEEAEDWKKECEAAFPNFEFFLAPLSLSVSCHIGHGALAIACAVEQ